MWKKKKNSWILAAFSLVLCVMAGYYISALFTFPDVTLENYQQYLPEILSHPFRNYWNEKTRGCIYIAVFAWFGFMVYITTYYRNFLPGKEHGSAEWANIKLVMNAKGDLQGRILSQNVTISTEADKISNNNMLVNGSPGTGKSFRIVGPNLLVTMASTVILDVKGDLMRTYGKALEQKGTRIRCLDLISSDFGMSHCYNPFVYIKTEVDLIRLVTNIQSSVTPPDSFKGDPFWEDGVTLYLMSCFYYVWMEMEHPSLPKVQSLMNEESRVIDDDTGETELERRMNRLAARSPMKNEHPAVSNYRKLKEGASDTVRSIIIMCNAKFKFMGVAAAKRLFSEDEMNLHEIGMGVYGDGKTRTALFLCVPDDDHSFDFIIGMLYTQLFHVLIEDARLSGGSLPIPVEVWMDEFANGARPTNFEKLITTLRSRNISVIMFIQSVSQLKQIYKNDTWEILFDACSAFVYLGAGRAAHSTHKFISELLNTATIDKRNEGIHRGNNGSTNTNFDRQGRELMRPDEVAKIPSSDMIIFLEGESPIYDKKYKTQRMKAFKEARKLGKYTPDVQVKKTETGYVTIKPEGQLIPLNEDGLTYYRKKEESGENVRIYEISEEDFLEMDFSEEAPEITAELLEELVRKNIFRMEARETISTEWDMSGSIFECIDRYYKKLTAAQKEEILKGLECGLSEDDVKSYFNLPAEEMSVQRRLLVLQRRK